MNDAVFIGDLHLHPQALKPLQFFQQWLRWAKKNTRAVYILGDFFHACAGDDTLDAWSQGIMAQLRDLVASGVSVYFMPGNRDFLLGEQFARAAAVDFIPEPTVLQLGSRRVLLVHGDGYCLDDKSHQWFRYITRSTCFRRFFLALPQRVRRASVRAIRQRSQQRASLVIKPATLAQDARLHQADVIIHGHIHQPQITAHTVNGLSFQQMVVSDWDVSPLILCYNDANGFYFTQVNDKR